ncbi:MAG: queuosine precursor transporter, partial [Flavobacteriales bacterium]
MKQLDAKDKEVAFRLYLILAALFVASLVTCNLIFRKFFSIGFFEGTSFSFTLEQSVGLLPYPITFLLTDMISETFGRKKANLVVAAGLISSLLVLLIIWLADSLMHAEWSPVTSNEFSHVFGQTFLAVGASMCAYLIAQFIDIRIFHYWKTLTNGKKLWLRNNFSTISSQFVDTLVVLLLLCLAGEIPW